MYIYKCIQIPVDLGVKTSSKTKASEVASSFLEKIINEMAGQGWEFYRIDNMTIYEKPGCFASLFGKKEAMYGVGVITFRRES